MKLTIIYTIAALLVGLIAGFWMGRNYGMNSLLNPQNLGTNNVLPSMASGTKVIAPAPRFPGDVVSPPTVVTSTKK